ncbi:hypothetical protein [Acrocarpospora sp. B8E8]|uniref:hypothetical protein n=1 Tax=Acrocarpospora sp. B8E8 TaxID=3153572 RepID=UPI00325DD2AC
MSAPVGFAEFVAARGTSLLPTAHLTCGSAQEAEDVLQSALERACRSWHPPTPSPTYAGSS